MNKVGTTGVAWCLDLALKHLRNCRNALDILGASEWVEIAHTMADVDLRGDEQARAHTLANAVSLIVHSRASEMR